MGKEVNPFVELGMEVRGKNPERNLRPGTVDDLTPDLRKVWERIDAIEPSADELEDPRTYTTPE